jgi:hypothetical protein
LGVVPAAFVEHELRREVAEAVGIPGASAAIIFPDGHE